MRPLRSQSNFPSAYGVLPFRCFPRVAARSSEISDLDTEKGASFGCVVNFHAPDLNARCIERGQRDDQDTQHRHWG